jgi:leader peptidase (prepilin peptidase) / N-methyltransferase
VSAEALNVLMRIVVALPFGLVVGSFLTVVIHRMPAEESLVRPRSRCPGCGTEIANRDNVPVASWLLLRGRCRTCGAAISPVYPLTELATGALFVATALVFDDPWVVVLVCAFLALMPAVAVIDVRHHIIPNRLMYPSLIVLPIAVVAFWALGADLSPVRAGLGFLAYGGGLLVVALISGGMGMGDVKLAGVIGVVLGALGLRYVAVAAGAAIVLGGVGGLLALLMGRSRRDAIPFGPYMAAGAMVAVFVGDRVASAYLGLYR